MAFIDCTEQQIPRIKNKENQRKMYFSEKRNRRTIVKNHRMVNNHDITPIK